MTLPGIGPDKRPMFWLRDADGVPQPATSLDEWSQSMYGPGIDRHLAADQVGRYFISTIFTGIDTQLRGPPLLYETMVFAGDDASRPRRQIRAPTAAEALALHAALLEEYTAISRAG